MLTPPQSIRDPVARAKRSRMVNSPFDLPITSLLSSCLMTSTMKATVTAKPPLPLAAPWKSQNPQKYAVNLSVHRSSSPRRRGPRWCAVSGHAVCLRGDQIFDLCFGDNALGKSRESFSTKIHVLVDTLGKSLHIELTGGQRHEASVAEKLTGHAQGTDFLADKAYGGERIHPRWFVLWGQIIS